MSDQAAHTSTLVGQRTWGLLVVLSQARLRTSGIGLSVTAYSQSEESGCTTLQKEVGKAMRERPSRHGDGLSIVGEVVAGQ
jgi:hypothetical protein